MFCFMVCRLVRQVLGGMPAAAAARVLRERPAAVLKAYLRERGVMQRAALVGLEDFRHVRTWLEQQTFAVEPNTTRAVVLELAYGSTPLPPRDVAWAEQLFKWAEAKRRGKKAMDGWMQRQQTLYEAGMVPKERAHVLEVLGREWIV